nr:hypothetical protein [Okeania sp. SIO2C9]
MQYISNLQGSPLMFATACSAKIQLNRVVNLWVDHTSYNHFLVDTRYHLRFLCCSLHVGQVFFFLGSSGSIRTHSLSVKLLEYGIFSASWRSRLSITFPSKDTLRGSIEAIWYLFKKLQVQYPSGFYDSGSHFS